jgi:hypothetical protein
MISFNTEDFISDKRLSGEFLLGYHCQRANLWEKKITVTLLQKLSAREELLAWFSARPKLDSEGWKKLYAELLADDKREWAEWLEIAVTKGKERWTGSDTASDEDNDDAY